LKSHIKKYYQIFLFTPILFYFGKRSLIAFDEGFYTLQAKWILENNNWVAPLWWGNISLDRTIGIQSLLAFSQKLFGMKSIAYIFPITFAGVIMLYITYHLHKELLGNDFAIISPLILSTTFLWVNYVNMATQDIVFASLVSIGILSTIKSAKNKTNFYLFFAGIWLGLAIMMKTYLALIPFLAIFPFNIKTKIFQKKYYWIGLFFGLLPFIIWSLNIINIYGSETFLTLHQKLLFLSKNNNFTNPFFYYLWNLPLNLFPWSIPAIVGLINCREIKDNYANYFLFKFPIILILLLSLFSTKTPYYPIQLLSIISINTFIGIKTIFKKNKFYLIFINKFLFVVIPFILSILSILLITNSLNVDYEYRQIILISIGIILFSLVWFMINFSKSLKIKILLIIVGAYLFTVSLVQSGFITDRSRALRIAGDDLIKKEFLKEKKIEVIKSDLGDQNSVSKIIKIMVLMPRIGNGIDNLNQLKPDQYAWTTISSKELLKSRKYTLIDESDIYLPWKLIQKN